MKKILLCPQWLVLALCASWLLPFTALHASPDFFSPATGPGTPAKVRQTDPPVFVDPTPNDTTVTCFKDVPVGDSLLVSDDVDGNFYVHPVDNPDPMSIDACVGDTIIRTWTAMDTEGNMTSVSQMIIVLPDIDPPVVTIPEVHDTVDCQAADYAGWINDLRIELGLNINNAFDDCSGIGDFDDDGSGAFTSDCGTRMVTFTITDKCGFPVEYFASYTTIDTTPPVLIGLPADNDTITCADPVPAPPMVTANDLCDHTVPVTFQQDTILITCAGYSYDIRRRWTAQDDCGNMVSHTQIIAVRDLTPPNFDLPPDIVIGCHQDSSDLNLTGNLANLMDNCSPADSITVTYVDQIQAYLGANCPQERQFIRTWRATDICGNLRAGQQIITLRDQEAPDFTPPANITVDCDDANNLMVTGEPTDLQDNCDPAPTISYNDVVVPDPNGCAHSYAIHRTWESLDACGNTQAVDQIITVIDTISPTFESEPQYLILNCTDGLDVGAAFNDWINNHGGAQAEDNCSGTADLTWSAFNAGTGDPAILGVPMCPSGSDTILLQMIDFVVADECGNRDTTTAAFLIVDNAPPTLSQCPADQTVATDPGQCSATYVLEPPLIVDACATAYSADTLHAEAILTSNAAPGQETDTPVNPVDLQFAVNQPLPVNASGSGTLIIQLINTDAEEPTEYFNVKGEDGTQLGVTNHTQAQCGASVTPIMISAAQINAWALDGVVTIHLVPNIPVGQLGRFAINAICQPQSMVIGDIYYTVKDLNGIQYQYRVNDGPLVTVDPIGPASVVLPQGNNLITYVASDCSGRSDSCMYVVTVADQEPPAVDCPDDILVSLATGECTAEITLPLPDGITDNCAVFGQEELVVPADTAAAWLTFTFDPNLNDYLANNRTLVFNNVAANAFGDVTITVDLRGDFDSNLAFMRVLGEDSSLLGVTNVGIATCTTPGQETYTIPAATFNAWANDGTVTIHLEPNDITVPPGVAGDGINACGAVDANGVDSISYAFGTLKYSAVTPSYFAQGATVIPLTTMQAPVIAPVQTFNRGETTVSYIVADIAGNKDTCSFLVTVEDNEPPMAQCQPTTLFINPSGLDVQNIDPAEIDAGSSDNCGITSMTLSPNTFNCSQSGMVITATLTVEDASGNSSSCNTIVAVSALLPQPTANSGLCGGDTLYLFTNPPPAMGNNIFTYRWYNPQGILISTVQNPVIPNINANAEGPYRVEIRGITGCTAENVVIVNIEDLPLTPSLITAPSICSVDNIVLNSSIFPSGTNVTFRWYEGTPPNGTLIGATSEPNFTLPGPHPLGSRTFYLTVEANGCVSPPSQIQTVTAVQKPVAMVSYPDTTVCGGTTLNLGTLVTGPGLTYRWTGPNMYLSNAQFPSVGPLASVNEGFYYLTVIRSGCESTPDSTRINVKPKPATPTISNNGPACAGSNIVLVTTSTGASAYHWISNTNQEFLTTSPIFTITNAQPSNSGPWRVYITKNGCDSDLSAPSNVVVSPVPDAAASANPTMVCEGSTLQLFASPVITDALYQWTGPNFVQVTPNPTISNITEASEGLYHLRITTQAGCTDTASVFVTVLRNVSITGISSDASSCLNGPTTIHLTPTVFPLDNGSYTYKWMGPQMFMSSMPVATIPGATAAVNNGNYTLVVTTSEGCSSPTSTFVLSAADTPATPPIPAPLNGQTSYCVGDEIRLVTNSYSGNSVTYYWQLPGGATIPTTSPLLNIDSAIVNNTGDYRVYVVVNGCVSGVSGPRPLVVHAIPSITATSNSPLCSGETLMMQAQQLPGATYEWSGPTGFTSGVYNPAINNANPQLHSGIYYVAATQNGCISDTVAIQVQVKPRPATPAIVNNGPICISDPLAALQLSINSGGTSGATYVWYASDGTTPLSVPSPNNSFSLTDFTGYGNSTYPFYVRATLDGCTSALSGPTQAVFNTIPANQAFAGLDTTICNNQSVLLHGTAPTIGAGLWSLVSATNPNGVSIANPNQANTNVNGLNVNGGPYVFQWTLSNGACVDYSLDTVTINVTLGEMAEAGDNFVVCVGEVVNLGALPPIGSGSNGVWTQPIAQQTLGVVIESPTDPNTVISGLEPDNLYTFTWTITSTCGVTNDQVFLTVSSESNAGPDVIACNDVGTGQLGAGAPTLGSSGQWSALNPQVVIDTPQSRNTGVHNLQEGENYFVWTIDSALCGNASRDTVVIFYKKNPVAQADIVPVPFGAPATFNVLVNDFAPPGSTAQVVGGPALGTATNLGNGDFKYQPPINFLGNDQLTYEVSSPGCQSVTSTVDFLIGQDAACKAPSIFTPNNDNINDFFVVPCLLNTDLYPNSQVQIFNRWGDEVYHSKVPYANDWNGTFNGEELPADTYFYIIDMGNGDEPMTGYVMIQR